QFRGQFEGRMKSLIDEVKALGNIILVIDEVHNLVGAGDAEGSMNAANILKPALSRGEIQVIGATTFKEYRKHIEKDSALERRFQPVVINEPSVEETFEILKGVKGYYESFHNVSIPVEAVRQAVYLADRYINDRFMPDKAIDLLDEACSDLNLHSPLLNERARLRDELAALIAERETLLAREEQSEGLFARVAEIKSREMQIEQRLSELEREKTPELSVDDLSRVIELWTKIPASRVREHDFERLLKLDERLREHIVGQNEAVDAVAAAIRRRRAGISEKRKPVSFLFVGPTGVGKTELVKRLAEDLFNTPDALIRLDMSEYMEKHSVSKLIGAPPGYVGYDEAGQLTEKLRRRPYSVVLFDEIEKAHPDVLNMLLQILDDGRITDAQGRYVSFENAVVIMTSNAGSERRDGAVGFGRTVTEQGREKALRALNDIMRPEFINRIDEIVSFNHLTEEDFARICRIMLEDLRAAVARNGITLTYDDALVAYLVKKSFTVKYGARNLRRLIEKEVEDRAAGLIIAAYENPLKHLTVSADDTQVIVTGNA
ncbi:MAG: ATP-dependent Clp protease ATP-binding subunit, partial [Clostridia bacterium]|nr:ATP-dependent Clp protease ATP-binding subunit [Clostridia bacterium]